MSIDQGSRAIGGQYQIGAGVYPAVVLEREKFMEHWQQKVL